MEGVSGSGKKGLGLGRLIPRVSPVFFFLIVAVTGMYLSLSNSKKTKKGKTKKSHTSKIHNENIATQVTSKPIQASVYERHTPLS